MKLAAEKDRVAQNHLAASADVMAEGILLKRALAADRSVETRSAASRTIDLWGL